MAPFPFMGGKFVSPQKFTRKDAGSALAAHMKYTEYRSMGENETREDRYIFNAENNHIQRREAVDDVMSHTSSRVYYHKIILSPAEDEHVQDFRQWTRDIMSDLQEKKGINLHWYAVVQEHPREHINEPHVHLVLAGAGEDHTTGEMKAVRMTSQDDYQFMREQGREHSNYEFYHALENEIQELNRTDPVAREIELDHVDQTTEH